MHIVIAVEKRRVENELMAIFASCKYIDQFSHIASSDELFELRESSIIDVIFVFLDQSSELGTALFTDIQDQMLDLRRKVVIISPLADNLSKNHMLENVLSYPLEREEILDTVDSFYIEQDD